MIIVKILLGILALSIIVIIHEAGHMLAARRNGIVVEAFSVGWGKVLSRWRRGQTEYRISLLPLGGYCKLQGENAFSEAWEQKEAEIPLRQGDFYNAAPWRRISVALAGPGFNFLFAFLVFSLFWMIGFSQQSYDNRIVLVSDIEESQTWPADRAGLETGDRILSIGGTPIEHYREIQEEVAPHARETLEVTYSREDQTFRTQLTPQLNSSTGGGQIGIYPWIPLEISEVAEGSPADQAGLREGDVLVSAGGESLGHYMELAEKSRQALLSDDTRGIDIGYRRDNRLLHGTLAPRRDPDNGRLVLGISVSPRKYTQRAAHPGEALWKGLVQTWDTIQLTWKGLTLLFQGLDLNKAVAGPLRLIYMMGDVTAQSLSAGPGLGFYSFFQFIAFISVALGFMNLLPIPALDGGQILLFVIETVKGSRLKPSFVIPYQIVGMALVLLLIIFATTNDLMFMARS